MNFPSSERLVDALARSQRHREGEHKAEALARGQLSGPQPLAFTIALTRETGSRVSLVADKLSERLGWPVYDQELLRRVAEDMGLRTSLLESVDEKRFNWVVGLLDPFAVTNRLTEGDYVHHLSRVVLALAANGECILVGRGAAHFLPPAWTLRVRLVAPLEDRIQTIRELHGVTREAAAKRVADTDAERNQFVREHFSKDTTNAANYDLVLNTSRLAPAECADLIAQALHRMQARKAGAGATVAPA
jgi:cytidylate kinase